MPAGRPTKSAAKHRRKAIGVYLSPAELRQFRQLIVQHGETASAYGRRLFLRAIREAIHAQPDRSDSRQMVQAGS
jgi:hypothetical protein